jgi:SdrD B-like domain
MCCGLCVLLQAQTVRVEARGRILVNAPPASVAYTLDPDCADAQVEGNYIVVVGVRPCSTYLIVVTGDEAHESVIIVSASAQQLDRLRTARLSSQGIEEAGSVSTFYSSDREELETTVDLARTIGNHSATMSLALSNGYAYSPLNRRTVIPHASLQFKGPCSTVTLLDGVVPEAPTVIADTRIRGIHLESRNWFFHGGVASLTNFQENLVDDNPDYVIVAGYRVFLSKHSSISAAIQRLSASSRYVTGRSGTAGSLLYRFDTPSRLRFEAEGVFGNFIGVGSLFEYTGDNDHLDLRFRSTSAQFVSLSMSPPRGLYADGNWSHPLNEKLVIEMSGAKNSLDRFDGQRDGNSDLTERLQWRFHRFTASAGVAFAEFSHAGIPTFRSLTVPLGLSFERHGFGNSFQYQVGHAWGADASSLLLADSLHLTVKPFTFRAYAGRQTQAPTLNYVLANIPLALKNSLLSAGVSLTSPEEIRQFLSTHSDLIAGGYISDFSVNLTPVRRYAGGSVQWSAPRNRLSARVESRIDDDNRVGSHVVSVNHNLSFSSQFRRDQLTFTASLFRTELLGNIVRSPSVSFGISHRLGNVPDIITRFQAHGFIRGMVFADTERNGTYLTGDPGIEGALVTLDGTRRVRTNQTGRFSFGFVPAGTHTVEVQYERNEAYVFTSSPHVETSENSTINFGVAVRSTQLFGSVRNDAGRGIAGIVVRLADKRSTETSQSGTFVVNLAKAAEITVSLDLNSIPPGYALDELSEKTVVVDADHPGHADFIIRALRSIAGTVTCRNRIPSISGLQLEVDNKSPTKPFDSNGNYVVRDMAAGRHDLVLRDGPRVYRQTIDISSEPGNLAGVNFEICDAGSQF